MSFRSIVRGIHQITYAQAHRIQESCRTPAPAQRELQHGSSPENPFAVTVQEKKQRKRDTDHQQAA